MEHPILVRQDSVPLKWHDVVIVVRSVADAVVERRIGSIPTAGELALTRDGTFYVPPGAVASVGDATQAEAALRQLLSELLPTDAPAELRELANGTGSVSASSPEQFRDAVAFFERPSSGRDRQALAARLEQIQQERRLQEEIERLKHKTRTDDPPHPSHGERRATEPVKDNRLPRKTLLVLAALGAAAGIAIALTFAPASAEKALVAVAPANAEATGSGVIARLRNVARSTFGKTTTQAEAPDPSVGKDASAKPDGAFARRSVASQGRSSADRPVGAPPRASRLEMARLHVLPASASALPALTLPDDFARVFTPGDSDVDPPELLRPHLPTVASVGLPRGQLGTVDVLVTEDGRVEQVRLVNTTAERRYYDAMILAAVKAWVFRPAEKSGQPVRYRMQIRLT